MSKETGRDQLGKSHETSVEALTVLTRQVCNLLKAQHLDNRLAAKLLKQLRKEADVICKADRSERSELLELADEFHSVDAALRAHDASLLVAAQAALRRSDRMTE
jgi:hypothetical protein